MVLVNSADLMKSKAVLVIPAMFLAAVVTIFLTLFFAYDSWASAISWFLCLSVGVLAVGVAYKTKRILLGIAGVVLLVFPVIAYAATLGLYWVWMFAFERP